MSENMENIAIDTETTETTTSVKIGDDVVSVIAGLAASEVEGVAGMSVALPAALPNWLAGRTWQKV